MRFGAVAWGAVIATMLAGCRAEPSRPARLVPHAFLADLVAAARGWREPMTATIGRRTHYVLRAEGTRSLEVLAGQPVRETDDAGRLTVEVSCPVDWQGRELLFHVKAIEVLDPKRRRPALDDVAYVERDDVALCVVGKATALVVEGLPSRTRFLVSGVTGVVRPGPRTGTPWIDLPARAVLQVSIGLQRAGTVPDDAVEMRVEAEAPSGARHPVGSWTLGSGSPKSDAPWREVEASLDEAHRALGERVRLVFDSTSPVAQGGMTLPAWGDPTIMVDAGEPTAPPPWNVVLISLDTLRADRLGTYGYPLPITPVLDRLAAEGTVMDRATAPANWTLPSHASMLTGLHACGHGFERRRRTAPVADIPPFPPAVRPLAEQLREGGWMTAAFTENAYVDRVPFQRGFGRFEANRAPGAPGTARGAETTFGDAAAWLAAHGEAPFFLFVHTYQVHAPYTPPAEERARIPTPLPLPPGGLPPDPEMAGAAADYVAEVAYTDRVVGTFLDTLARLGLAERTVVLVTSDHGEAFGEHGHAGHGLSLYEEELRIPMLWWAPRRIAAGRRVDELVTLADVTPTILALLGRPLPPWMQGTDLSPLLDAAQEVDWPRGRVVPIEGMFAGPGARGWNWKLLSTKPIRRRTKRLLFLSTDPQEVRPTWVQPAFIDYAVSRLRHECERTRRLLSAEAGASRPGTPTAVDPSQARKLRALGYAE